MLNHAFSLTDVTAYRHLICWKCLCSEFHLFLQSDVDTVVSAAHITTVHHSAKTESRQSPNLSSLRAAVYFMFVTCDDCFYPVVLLSECLTIFDQCFMSYSVLG